MTLPLRVEKSVNPSAGRLRWALAPVREVRRMAEDGRDDQVVELLQQRPYEELRANPEMAVLFATALAGQGRLQDAQQLSDMARTASRALGDDRSETLATMLCGDIAFRRGDLAGASSSFGRARALATEQHNAALAGECSARVGQIALRRDDPTTATGAFLAAIATYQSAGAEREALECQPELAKAYCALACLEDALGTSDRAVDTARDFGDPGLHAEMLAARAEVRLSAGDSAVALSEAVWAAAVHRSLDQCTKEAEAMRLAKRAQAALDSPRALAETSGRVAPSVLHAGEMQNEADRASQPELMEKCHV